MEKKQIIVSLTSYPKRIGCVDKVIKTILIQTMKPDKILLWLADSEFPNKMYDLPNELIALCSYGLEIRWCNDVKSHKKYLYAMQEYPDSCIITIDDDVFYCPNMIEVLYKSFLRHPDAVSCLRANRITFDNDNRINSYSKWTLNEQKFIDIPLMDLMAVGVGGVLYPPGCIEEQFLDEVPIMKLCLCQDDLWLKYAQIHSGVSTVIAKSGYSAPNAIEGTEKSSLSGSVNVLGNDVALECLRAFYDNLHQQTFYIDSKILTASNTCINVEKKRNEQKATFIEYLKTVPIIIYGAGRDAQATYDCLRVLEEKIKIRCFAVTSKERNPKCLYNIPVMSIDEVNIEEGTVIIVAMDELWHSEVTDVLKSYSKCEIYYISNEQMGLYFKGKLFLENSQNDFLISLRR